MKKIILFGILSFYIGTTLGQQDSTLKILKGIVKDEKGDKLREATVQIIYTKTKIVGFATTDSRGRFFLMANEGDTLLVSISGFNTGKFIVKKENFTSLCEIKLYKINNRFQDASLAGGTVSPKNFWLGAKLGYNFDGFSEDDLDNYFIGAATIVLNKLTQRVFKGDLTVVGNVAGFISNQNKKDAQKDMEKLALSVQGLGVGLANTWEQPVGNGQNPNYFRQFVVTGYRLNTFKKVGKDSITVNLSQFRTIAGIELEINKKNFEKEAALTFSLSVTNLIFDKKKYEILFGKSKSSLTSVELNTILPVNSNFGFFVSGTFTPDLKPTYLFGLFIK